MLTELVAFEASYKVLAPLDETARRRALTWLADVLTDSTAVSEVELAAAVVDTPVAPPAAAQLDEPDASVAATVEHNGAVTESVASSAPVAKPGRPAGSGRRPKVAGGATSTRSKRGKAVPMPVERNGRAYRRMPDVTEVLGVYEQIGTISGLAEHFAVPAHTAQSWARRLRSQGHHIGRS